MIPQGERRCKHERLDFSPFEQELPVVRARHEVRFWPGGRAHAYIRKKTRVYAAFRLASPGACPLGREIPRVDRHDLWCAAKVALVRSKGQNGAHQKLLWCAAEDKMVRSKSCSGAQQKTKWCANLRGQALRRTSFLARFCHFLRRYLPHIRVSPSSAHLLPHSKYRIFASFTSPSRLSARMTATSQNRHQRPS